jgi:hypothetical protein
MRFNKSSPERQSQPSPMLGKYRRHRIAISWAVLSLLLLRASPSLAAITVGDVMQTSATPVVSVVKAAILTGPATEPTVINHGASANVVILVTGQSSRAGIAKPSGSISYIIASGSAQVAMISNGTATIAIPRTLAPGTYNISVNYAGDANYGPAGGIVVRLKVRWITPTLTFAPPASIVYGTTLIGELTASASYNSSPVAGTFAYSATPLGGAAVAVTAGTVLTAGIFSLSAMFTPIDRSTYSTVSRTVMLTVCAGSVTTIEPLGVITASQVANGLGFNVAPGNDWEFQMAAAAGATQARFQCGWTGTENQVAPPGNTPAATQFTLASDCQAGLVSSFRYSLHPTVLAAYGPPFHQILSITLPDGAAAGASEIDSQFASGIGGDTIASMAAFYDTIISSSNAYITNKHSYAGGLITGVKATDSTHATLELASALSSGLPADTITKYVINEYLYPPPASFSPADPSVLAYARYAEFLASRISTSGVTGEVEIWNEPPWNDDPWDDRYDFYDNQPLPVTPGPQTTYLPNWGFAAALFSQASPASGVTYNWGGTEKTGGNSMLNAQMEANTGVSFWQPNTIVTTESFHPYGNNPEDTLWSEPCLETTINPYPKAANSYFQCNLFGVGPNIAYAAQQTLVQKSINPSWGIGHNITETGFEGALGDDLHKARFVMRQFLGFQSAGVTPIQFYRLFDTSPADFSFVNRIANADGTHDPLPAYTALAGLMSDLAKIKVNSYPAQNLPLILAYSGTYPLDTVSLVGSRPGDSANSILFAMWQRSYTSGTWATLASPDPTPVTVQIPALLSVVAVLNLDTRTPVAYTAFGQQITFTVADDPIELLLEPTTGSQ